MRPELRTQVVEAALLAAGRALGMDELAALFEDEEHPPTRSEIRDSIAALRVRWEGRALELAEVSSGFRMQVRTSHARWMTRLWARRPPRYSRALLETLALIAYRQPITRGQIEDVRGVSVSTSIIRTLLDREWIRIVGHREVPGRPDLFGTTRTFLDHFNLKSLEELPALQDIRDIEEKVPDLFRDAAAPALAAVSGGEPIPGGEGPSREDGATNARDDGPADSSRAGEHGDPGAGVGPAAADVGGPLARRAGASEPGEHGTGHEDRDEDDPDEAAD